MTTRCEPMSLSSKPFQPVPALPRHFRDGHFSAFMVRSSRSPRRRPSLWWQMSRLPSGVGLLLAVVCGLRPVV
ncbi:MAG: hypothetical protein ABI895_22185 [Deltaproteobacteria bacterium]